MTGLFSCKLVRDARRGFTLIEIMIGLMIIGLLMGFVIPQAYKMWEQAKTRSARQELQSIRFAIEQYQMDTGMYPGRLRDLIKRPTGDERIAVKWTGPYLAKKEVPRDPWGNAYSYRPTEGGKYPYELYSYGPQGKAGPKAERVDVHYID